MPGSAFDVLRAETQGFQTGHKATNEFLRIILNYASGAAEKGK